MARIYSRGGGCGGFVFCAVMLFICIDEMLLGDAWATFLIAAACVAASVYLFYPLLEDPLLEESGHRWRFAGAVTAAATAVGLVVFGFVLLSRCRHYDSAMYEAERQGNVAYFAQALDSPIAQSRREALIGGLERILRKRSQDDPIFPQGMDCLFSQRGDMYAAPVLRSLIQEKLLVPAEQRIEGIASVALSEPPSSTQYKPGGTLLELVDGHIPEWRFENAEPRDISQSLREITGAVWIVESATKVGIYRKGVLGQGAGEALQLHWDVAVIDLGTRRVTARTQLLGGEPPKEVGARPGTVISVAGPAPREALREWLLSLPTAIGSQ